MATPGSGGQDQQRNLQAILRWSLAQQGDGTQPCDPAQMDPERRQWLEGALASVVSAGPSETEILKAALVQLKTHGDSAPDLAGETNTLNEEDSDVLDKAFQQIIYLIEDVDHAKGMSNLENYFDVYIYSTIMFK